MRALVGRIMLKWDSKEIGYKIEKRINLAQNNNGGLFWIWQRVCGFRKMYRSCWRAENCQLLKKDSTDWSYYIVKFIRNCLLQMSAYFTVEWYSGGSGFKFRPRDCFSLYLSLLKFVLNGSVSCRNCIVSVINESLSVEHWWEDKEGGKSKHLEINLSQCRVVEHKSAITWPGIEPASSRWVAHDQPPEP
jgi:hypothetical protein